VSQGADAFFCVLIYAGEKSFGFRLHGGMSMKSIKIAPIGKNDIGREKTIFLAFFKDEPLEKREIFSVLMGRGRRIAEKFIKSEIKGDEGETKTLWFAEGKPERFVFFSLGEQAKWNSRKTPILTRRMVRFAREERIGEFATDLHPAFIKSAGTARSAAKIFAVNSLMANFEFTRYKETPKGGWPDIAAIRIISEKTAEREIMEGIREGGIIGEETNFCRDLANTPGGDMTPQTLAEAASETARRTGLHIRVLEERDMQKLGMGAVLGVGRGSNEKPCFIILEYKNGPKREKPLVLAGKGVTFDTGGLNLKSTSAIYEMHLDMSGGAAVIHGLGAVSRLDLPLNAVGLIPAVENMPSGSSYHPGDVLKSFSGKMIEVLNTDAEGRVILADALAYGAKTYSPGLMVDFATLTGAAHVAVGSWLSALFVKETDEVLSEKLIAVGNHSGDYVWPLPLWEEYLPEIKGTFGDIANTGVKDRWGGAIHGAKFLEQFAGETRWAHIDIAPRMTAIDSEYLAKGASGVGVRFIADLAKEYPALLEGER
jgi:leucyl aminopeptidase